MIEDFKEYGFVLDNESFKKDKNYVYLEKKVQIKESPIISLCTLAGLNLGKVKHLHQMRAPLHRLVRATDGLLTYQDYPVPAARVGTELYRPLGIGVINFAYYLAKHNARYSDDSGLKLTHELFEAFQYYLIEASVQLAKDFGPCPGFQDTKYSKGILPIDTYAKAIDEFANFPLLLDWESLRENVLKYGMRNSTLSALFPAETSSWISNATNGTDPITALTTIKGNKENVLKVVAPDAHKLKNKYESIWEMPNMEGYLRLYAVMQKFIDQSISLNTYYNPDNYRHDDPAKDRKIPASVLVKDILYAAKYGIKTMYYSKTNDGNNQMEESNLQDEEKEENIEKAEHDTKKNATYVDDSGACDSGACAL